MMSDLFAYEDPIASLNKTNESMIKRLTRENERKDVQLREQSVQLENQSVQLEKKDKEIAKLKALLQSKGQ